jgi:hypothetical protein
LSNLDSSEENEDEFSSDLSSMDSDEPNVGNGLFQSKPWNLPEPNATPFQVKNPIFFSPKGKQEPKEGDFFQLQTKPSGNAISQTPVPKMTERILSKLDLELDSPQSKLKYKNFLRDLKEINKGSFISQLKYCLK